MLVKIKRVYVFYMVYARASVVAHRPPPRVQIRLRVCLSVTTLATRMVTRSSWDSQITRHFWSMTFVTYVDNSVGDVRHRILFPFFGVRKFRSIFGR